MSGNKWDNVIAYENGRKGKSPDSAHSWNPFQDSSDEAVAERESAWEEGWKDHINDLNSD